VATDAADDDDNGEFGGTVELLDLSGLSASRITSRVYELYGLQQLVLQRNQLSKLSPDIADLVSVHVAAVLLFASASQSVHMYLGLSLL
jgi:hypothetical protein